MRGLDPDVIAQRAQDLLEVMGLTGAERTLIVDYSTGMRKKIGLATALLHAPRLLVLDEPFEAVDPVSAATLRGILTGFVANGGSVVLSSHVMALVEQLCDTVAIMARGVLPPLARSTRCAMAVAWRKRSCGWPALRPATHRDCRGWRPDPGKACRGRSARACCR